MFRDFKNYEVFEDGKIWSYKTNRFLKPQTEKNGYQRVALSDNEGQKKIYYLHRIVYESVSGEPIPEGMQINHIDERKDNNQKSNLNLMSRKENIRWGSGIARRAKTQSKQVGAFKNDELVMTFHSIMEASRNGFNQGHISSCCNGERKTHKGFEWRYI